ERTRDSRAASVRLRSASAIASAARPGRAARTKKWGGSMAGSVGCGGCAIVEREAHGLDARAGPLEQAVGRDEGVGRIEALGEEQPGARDLGFARLEREGHAERELGADGFHGDTTVWRCGGAMTRKGATIGEPRPARYRLKAWFVRPDPPLRTRPYG